MPELIPQCGVDEAGRGPLAGPVYAAAVILDPNRPIPGLADSKILSPGKRQRLSMLIQEQALAWSIASASVEEIDSMNILKASLLAMQRAVKSLKIAPGIALIDGNRCPELECASKAIIGGDAIIPSISAASILAKVARDEEMMRLHELFPVYGLDRHKGYPTRAHISALRKYGICEIHRRSFGPVKILLAEELNYS